MALDMSDFRLLMQAREDAAKAHRASERALQLLDHVVRQNDAILTNQRNFADAFNSLARQVLAIEKAVARIEAQLSPPELDKSSARGLKG